MEYCASGKLMLFGEYLVLRGTKCLAIPLKYGQSMRVSPVAGPAAIAWTAITNGEKWFSASFSLGIDILDTSDTSKARALKKLLTALKEQDPSLFAKGLAIETETNFPREWGFGTSSTLVSLMAQWSGVNPYLLLKKSFGGSGYDVACATAHTPILYRADTRETHPAHFAQAVTSKILFVYSGKKQASAPEVNRFNTLEIAPQSIEKMNAIVASAVESEEIEVFEKAMAESEQMLSEILKLPQLKEKTFENYPYAIKSLGAWGGDFFMATFRDEAEARAYFEKRGYPIQFTYDQLIKK